MVASQPPGFENIGASGLLQQAAQTKGQQEATGAGIADSETGKLALAKYEELQGTKARFDATLQSLKAQKADAQAQQNAQQGQQNVQQGGVQQKIGETMVQTGTALLAAGAATFGTTAYVGLAMIATGTGVALTGGQQQQQGQQQVESAPAYQSEANAYQAKSNELDGQSSNHLSTAQQLQSEAETEQQDAAQDDPNGAKAQGQQKGYFVGDNLADASSSEDESTIAKLRDGAGKIGGIGGTSNDKELVADASSEEADGTPKTLADKLKNSSDAIAAITGNTDTDVTTQSLETKGAADVSSSEDESTIAKLRDGADKVGGIGGTQSLETKKEAVA